MLIYMHVSLIFIAVLYILLFHASDPNGQLKYLTIYALFGHMMLWIDIGFLDSGHDNFPDYNMYCITSPS